jgi:hypothetical protein
MNILFHNNVSNLAVATWNYHKFNYVWAHLYQISKVHRLARTVQRASSSPFVYK